MRTIEQNKEVLVSKIENGATFRVGHLKSEVFMRRCESADKNGFISVVSLNTGVLGYFEPDVLVSLCDVEINTRYVKEFVYRLEAGKAFQYEGDSALYMKSDRVFLGDGSILAINLADGSGKIFKPYVEVIPVEAEMSISIVG